MKILKLSLLAMMALLASCGSDDPLSETIIGTWEVVSVQSTGCDDPMDNLTLTSVDSNGCLMFQGDTLCDIALVFAADGTARETLTVDSGQESEEFTYTTNDDNDTATICESAADCMTLSFDGDTMTRTILDAGCTTVVTYEKA